MVRGGYKRKEDEWGYQMTNQKLLELCNTESISAFTARQKQRYLAHIIRLPDMSITKRIAFNSDLPTRPGRRTTFLKSVLQIDGSSIQSFARKAVEKTI